MENFPDDILEYIFDHLDNESMLRAIKVCERWRNVFVLSSRLMKKLFLKIEGDKIHHFEDFQFPIRNLTLSKISIEDDYFNSENFQKGEYEGEEYSIKFSTFMKIFENFSHSVEILKLDNVVTKENVSFFDILNKCENLKHIELEKVEIFDEILLKNSKLIFPRILSVSLNKCNPIFLLTFQAFTNLQKIKYIDQNWFYSSFSSELNYLLEKLPKIQHLILEGVGTAGFFESGPFKFKIKQVDAYLTTFYWTHREGSAYARTSFFKSQKDSLKELRLKRIPYDYDGSDILSYLFDEMNLEKFIYDETVLIEGGKKVDTIDEILFHEFQIKSGLELLRRFPASKKLKLCLTQTGIDKVQAENILSRETNLFNRIIELIIIDLSGHHNLLTYFSEMYKNCGNINKLTIDSNSEDLNQVLKESLPFMTQLEEIYLSAELTEQRIEIVRRNCLKIKKIEQIVSNAT